MKGWRGEDSCFKMVMYSWRRCGKNKSPSATRRERERERERERLSYVETLLV